MQTPMENAMARMLGTIAVGLGLWFGTAGFAGAEEGTAVHLDVYKSPTCGCCVKWMDHVAENGYTSTGHHPQDLGELKRELGVPARYGSCHTGVSEDGYVFEGHVPARFITQFLADPPEGALGLTVPAMPVGSPGMEYKDQFMPYEVLLLKKDGSVEVFASVESYEQQFE
jgi:hypothetical protein